jgi:hypothetical protein
MKKNLLLLYFSILFSSLAQGQMTFDGQLRYGNEWIDYEQSYLEIKTIQDGWYRLTTDQLRAAGLPIDEVSLTALRLERFGEPVPVVRNASEGYIAFYGVQNRGELDRQLYDDPDEDMLNPYYSMYSDTAVYYLSWEKPAMASPDYAEIPNDLNNLPEKEAWYRHTERKVFGEAGHSITYDGQKLLTLSIYDFAEGLGTLPDSLHNITFNPSAAADVGEEARLFIQLFSNRFNNRLNLIFNEKDYLQEDIGENDNFIKRAVDIPVNELQPTSVLTVKDLIRTRNQYGIAFAELTYPRSFDALGQGYFSFTLPAGNRRYFEIDNFDTEGEEVWVYNLGNRTRQKAEAFGSTVRFVTPASTNEAQLLIVNESNGYQSAAAVNAKNWEDVRESQADYLILTHQDLMKPDNGVNRVEEYAAYRRSSQGGGYNVQVMTVDKLYDQFAYGIHNHPQAIQNFSQWAVQHWPNLKYVLLLGHGYSYPLSRRGAQNLAPGDYIPTYGLPGSDNLMLAPRGSIVPSFAIGRVAARDAQEVKSYLDKLKEYDNNLRNTSGLEERLWRKRVLHIAGGSRADDQIDFKRRMVRLGEDIRQNGFGGLLTLVSKQSDEVVQQSTSAQVKEAMNAGVAIKAFLGHGGVTTTDFGLDNPAEFNNKGRYPLIFSLGCKTGDMYDQQTSLSESFSLAANRGGIGYIASAGFAYASTLEVLTREFYRLLGDELYTAGVGDILRSMRQNLEVPQNQLARYSLLEQMSYEGDPAIKLNLYKAPDYVVDPSTVEILPKRMTAAQDSFSVHFDVLNLGFNRSDTFAIQFRRTFPDGSTSIFKDTVLVGIGTTHFAYRFLVGEEEVEGEHRLEIIVDADNAVPEMPSGLAEQNNELVDDSGRKGIAFFVQQNAILPVSPPPFAIVNDEKPSLIASSNTLETRERNYVFELDTTVYFNSSLKKNHELQSRGGVLSWTPDLNWTDGQVYYWRVREKGLGELRWVDRSFIYFRDSLSGWNQSEYFQVATDSLMDLERLEEERKVIFGKGFISAKATAMSHTEELNNDASKFLYENNEGDVRKYWGANYWRSDGAWDSHIFVAVFDPKTGRYWRSKSRGEFGSIPISRDNYHGYAFLITQQSGRENMVRFIQEQIPDGHYVLVITSQKYDSSLKVEDWAADSLAYGTNIFQLLEAQGALQVRQLEKRGSLPYVFAFIKGVRPVEESLAFDITDQVTISFDVPFFRTEGVITSPLIGPARTWSSLSWQPRLPDGQTDEIDLTLLKWNADRSMADTMRYQESGYFDISDIDAAQYPYLQLKYRVKDPVDRSFTPLDHWRVTYERFPDLVLSTGDNFSFYADTLQQGEELKLSASLMAFNAAVQDSIEMLYRIRSSDNQTTEIAQKLGPQEVGSTQAVNFSFDTQDLTGDYELVVEANPQQTIQEDQYANNLGVLPFVVVNDNENPILDVTFDGRHILNGELVSARPLINISLTDENEYLEIQDTASFEIWLEFPDGATKEYYFDDPQIRFYPAEEGKKNRARVEFEPVLELDGEYQLRIRASDATGNVAGNSNYEVTFQVITESQLSNVLPYPNPFTTSCRFVYTLTGDREPADFKIQILTVSGRIVREITQFEFGPMKVGTHQSDFVWDGTDEYGDQLANGVYLYRVIAKDAEGEDLKRFERTEVDGYFKKDFGKIVILR